MGYISVKEAAKKWGISERTVRYYAKQGEIEGASQEKRLWKIPETAERPLTRRKNHRTLLAILQEEAKDKRKGTIYHRIQVNLTYNSNHMEGSRLTEDETRYIFETNTIGLEAKVYHVDDIIETVNHFKAIDEIILQANKPLTEKFIKSLHKILKTGTSDASKDWFAVGDYKKLPNEVGNIVTSEPENVSRDIKPLLENYNKIKNPSFEQILQFHHDFEIIHPFQDGNGRVGRLIMFKELLKHNYVPFIIDEELKLFYYRGLAQWENEKGLLIETCLDGQDKFKKYLDYYRIDY